MSGLIIIVLLFLIIYAYFIAIREILNEAIEPVVKILLIALVIFTNVIGIVIYYLILRGNLTRYFK